MRAGVRLPAAACLAAACAAPARAHEATRASLILAPQHPRVEQSCRLEVSLRTASGLARFAQRAWVVAEMGGHPMLPVTAELRRLGDRDAFGGELRFTMTGPWHVTLHVQDGADVLQAPVDVEVVSSEADVGAPETRYDVALMEPVRTTLLPPGWAFLGAIGLAAALEWTAIVFERRRRRKGDVR